MYSIKIQPIIYFVLVPQKAFLPHMEVIYPLVYFYLKFYYNF